MKVTHDGGDSIDSRELSVRGSGFRNEYEGSDDSDSVPATGDFSPSSAGDLDIGDDGYIGSAGQWVDNSASGDDSAVVSGDFIYVGVSSDYETTVNFEAQEGQSSATLSDDNGPDA